MNKSTKKLLWIFIPICAVLAAIILGLLLLNGLAMVGGFFLLLPSFRQGGIESLFPDTSITAPATNPTEPAHIHQWQDATCTAPKTCSVCGATEGSTLGHNYTSVVTEPTFEDYGYTTYTCTHCGDHYEDAYIDPIKLRYDAGTLVFCADGVAYLIGENQQLVETYTGWETETYNAYETPWYVYHSDIIFVVIEDGVSPESTNYWFGEFSNLERVRIGNAVTTIGNWAFAYCTNLTSITILDSVTTIDYAAFYECTSLTSITIPDSVTSIGRGAFYYCTSLTSITIPNSVTTIGEYAFYGCSSLTSITIPASLASISSSAFHYCTRLTSITFEGTIAEWNAITKGEYWNRYVPATEVICSDGIVQL